MGSCSTVLSATSTTDISINTPAPILLATEHIICSITSKKQQILNIEGNQMVVEILTDDTWPEFIAQRDAVLILTRNSCENCGPFVETLAKNDFPVAKVILDSPGNVGFKTAFPQISSQASVLPFSILFSRGEWLDSVMGARVGAVLEWFK